TPYYDEAVPHPSKPGEWTYVCPKSRDRLHALEVDFTEVAEYYKGDPDGGYQSFVYTDALAREDLVRLRDAVERDVRSKLGIPFNPARAAMRYEHSMGQGPTPLPPSILRASASRGQWAANGTARSREWVAGRRVRHARVGRGPALVVARPAGDPR